MPPHDDTLQWPPDEAPIRTPRRPRDDDGPDPDPYFALGTYKQRVANCRSSLRAAVEADARGDGNGLREYLHAALAGLEEDDKGPLHPFPGYFTEGQLRARQAYLDGKANVTGRGRAGL